jgi:hypothetical protein
MDKRLAWSMAVAAPLTAAGAVSAWWLLQPREVPVPVAIVEHCKRAAELLYDVSWAAACLKTDDPSVDCMLPDTQAARVNAILAAEEARCRGSYTSP